MDSRDTMASVLAALHDATLNDSLWPRASALIDDACGATGNAVVVGENLVNESRIYFRACYFRGERKEEVEQNYFRNYYQHDERVPRMKQLPDSLLVRTPDLYTEHEKNTSPAYNEALVRSGEWNGLTVRLDGPNDSRISWMLADPVQRGGWQPHHMEMIERLLPHLRHFVQVRQMLADAHALGTSLSGMLDNARVGVIHLDQRGRILEVNDRALSILRSGDGLSDQKGYLCAWLPEDDAKLQSLLAGALPFLGGQAAAGSMVIRRSANPQKIVLCINPLASRPMNFGASRVSALVVLTEPGSRPRLNAELVAETLGLTAAESQAAVLLSEGFSANEIAMATNRQVSTIYTLTKRAYRKLGVSRQAELVRLILSLADASAFRS